MEASDRQREATRSRIVQGALDVFARKGYHDATMDEIAAVSQVSKGSLYFHFPGKQQLFLALAETATNMLLENIEAAMAAAGASRRHKMRAAIEAAFRLFERHRAMARLVFLKMASLGPPYDARLMELHARIARLIRIQLDQAVVEGAIQVRHTEVFSWMWVGALHEVLVWWLHKEEPGSLMELFPALYEGLLRSIDLPPAEDERPAKESV